MQVTLQGAPFATVGEMPKVGEKAPKFCGTRADLSDLRLPELLGKRVVLNIFPSMDTAVCAASVRRFNKEAAALDNTVVLCVSKDLPFAMSRFCTTEGLENVIPVSTFRCDCFRKNYGLEIAEGPMRGLEDVPSSLSTKKAPLFTKNSLAKSPTNPTTKQHLLR